MRYSIKDLLSARGLNPNMRVKSPSIVNKVLQEPDIHRRLAARTQGKTAAVRAVFDVETAAIRANKALLYLKSRLQPTQHNLCDEDVETLVRAFAQVINYRTVFEEFKSPQDRAEAMMRRRSQAIMRSSEESYTNSMLLKQRQAEGWVQRVRLEILSSFDQAGHGSGFPAASIADKAEEFATEWFQEMRGDYVAKANEEYRHMVRDGSLDRAKIVDNNVTSARFAYKEIPVKDIDWMFPVNKSATLRELVDIMVQYNIAIVVPVTSN